MLPSSALASEFSGVVRNRGNRFATPAAVALVQGSATSVRAVVRDGHAYAVGITRIDDHDEGRVRFEVLCTCPYYYGRMSACAHIWAALLVGEQHGHLRGNPDVSLSPRQAQLVPVKPIPTDDGEDNSPDASRAAASGPSSSPAGTGAAFIADVRRNLQTGEQERLVLYPYVNSSLLYVIDGPASADGPTVVLHVMHQRRTKGGSLDRPKPAPLSPAQTAMAPATDRRLLTLLSGATRRTSPTGPPALDSESPYTSTFELSPTLALELLPPIARTARAWLRTRIDAPALEPLAWDDGNGWEFRLLVEDDEGGFRVGGYLVRDDTNVPLAESFVILGDALVALRGRLARFTPEATYPFLRELRKRGVTRVAADQAPELAEILAASGTPATALPEALRVAEVRIAPTPRLSVHHLAGGDPNVLTARLSFDYDGTIVETASAPSAAFDTERRRLVFRDSDAEAAAWSHLADVGFRPGPAGTSPAMDIEAKQFPAAARQLLADQWFVHAEGVRYRTAGTVRLSVTSGIAWFDLTATVDFGEHTAPLGEVLSALRREGPMVRLGDGSIGLLPETWLARYGTLTAAGEAKDGRIRFSRTQAALLDALLADRETEAEIAVDAVFERARQELASFGRLSPLDAPASFTGVLRPYQSEGLGWFEFLRRFGFGGCLADDMGLGKTIMVLALLDSRRASIDPAARAPRPSLVVVPRSLIGNWIAEAQRFTPGLRLVDHSHAQRRADAPDFSDCDAVLVTYGTLRRDITSLSSVHFDYVVLDEAQTIKNASTASAKAARLLRADHRLALSGTPIENHLGELWSLFEFLNPGILGKSSVFQRAATDAVSGPQATTLLSRGLRPFILRRTKQQVASELPARTEQTILCELLPKDRRLYDSLRRHYRGAILDRVAREGLGRSKMHVLEALLRLRQAACHAGLIDPTRAADESSKFDVLLPQLQEVVAEGHKAIVFSQFTTLLGLLGRRLDAAKVTYEYLDGKTIDRTARVQRFQEDPNVGIFLISLKAGGLGLNLTAADYVFLLDPWWNPAVEAQAIDRAHRIGQTREVFAYRLIAKDTVEEKVLELQHSKRALADAVLAADAVGLRHLSRDDLDLLLS